MGAHMRAFIAAVFFTFLSWGHAMAGEIVNYKDGDVELEGYLARTSAKNAPVVLVIHQWKGLSDNERMRADMLASLGYNALAIDVYGKGIRPQTVEAAGAEATKYKSDPVLARKRVTAALDYARTLQGMDTSRIAAIGYCFGGTMALELARSGADIKSVISFHGGLGTKAPVTKAGVIKASVAAHHGADDTYVPPAEVETFIAEMNTAKADWVFTSYAGSVHAFTQKESGNDPSQGIAYNEKADRRSWASAVNFLKETLGQ